MQPEGGSATEIGEAFWRFSLALYARPGVAGALIELQDRAGRDVNLILFALWVGAVHGIRLDAAVLKRAEAAIADLRTGIVEPLRGLRRRLKSDPAEDVQALRRKILALELAGERRVQQRLVQILSPADRAERDRLVERDRLAAAQANLALYLGAEAQLPEANLVRSTLASLTRRAC
jgi:uncharacterized protein (TIGR02444 family)